MMARKLCDGSMQAIVAEERRAGWMAAAFAVGSLFLFLYGIARFPGYLQDEQTYVPSARALIDSTSSWTMDHPPLGKSLVAAGIRLAGDNALGWRMASAAAGSLVLAAIMLCTYLLLRSVEYMVIAGCLTLFDNFLYVMSRIAMMDTFLMLFLFWGYLLFLAGTATEYDQRKRNICVMLSGILLGLAASCKWNALFSIAALFVIGSVLYLRQRNFSFALMLASLSALPAAAYAVTFIPLFRALGRPFTLSNLVRTQGEMYVLMKSLHGNDFINVPWFHWPFQIEPQRGLSYLVGNYAVMFCGLFALGVCAWRASRRFAAPEFTVVVLYLVNLLQWLVIPRKLVCYYYYYPCALLLGLALVLALAGWERKSLFGVRLNLIPVFAAAAIFLFCYPHMANLGAPWDTLLGYWR
jgi:dolichyl-phosphate-mannose-protein mannosyltransferase